MKLRQGICGAVAMHVLGVVILGCGPTWTAEHRFHAFQYEVAEAQILREETDEVEDAEDSDFVMHNMRLGSCALYAGDLRMADTYLKRATDIVDTSVGSGRGAVSVALWESAKYFKGEAYERIALYYYRGLANFLGGTYDIARASFHNALLTDKQSPSEQHREDAAIAYYMLARSYLGSGDRQNARIAIEKARNLHKDNPYFALSKIESDNLFLLVETGKGPLWHIGKYEHKTLMGRPSPAQAADVYIDGVKVGQTALATTWYYQGITEGSSGKDKLQSAKSCVWQIADVAGCDCLASLCAVSTKADSRAWKYIPDSVWVFSAKVSSGAHTVSLRYPFYEQSLREGGEGQKSWHYDEDLQGEAPRTVEVAVQNGQLVGYAEAHYHIGVPEQGGRTVLLRNGLGKHSKKQN
jgi:tetratricopeptide (TPR) repeat protein